MAPKVQYAHVKGDTLEEMRRNIPAELYNLGDARLVWVNEGDLCMVGQEIFGEPRRPPQSPVERALELIADNLSAWEDEEESVQEEHADLIAKTRAFVEEAARNAIADPGRAGIAMARIVHGKDVEALQPSKHGER